MISKRLHKKLAKKAQRKELKCVHQAKLHEIMLHYAKQIRAQLQVTTSAVPDNALYRNLTRMSENELFSNIANADLEMSVLFDCGGSGNSWTINIESRDTEEKEEEEDTTSPQSRCCRIIDRFVHRPHPYNIKYACQELSLIYQLYRLAYNPSHDVDLLDDDDNNNNNHSNSYYSCDAVIDIGGGNANLSCLISLILNVPVICVDYDPRHESLMAEKRIPQTINNNNTAIIKGGSKISVTRVECMIQNYTLPSTYRHVVVLGKHCCGTGTDAGIEFVNTYSSQIRGVVFATCCCCKIAHGLGVRSIENVITTKKDNNSNSDRACDNHNDDNKDDDDDIHEKEEEEEELNGVPVEAGLGNSSIQYFDSLYFSSTTTTMMCQTTGMEDTTNDKMDCSVTTTSMTANTDSVVHENERLLPPQEHDDDDDDNNVSNNNNSNCNTTTKYNLDNYTGLSGASARRLANAANNNNNNDNKLNNESEIELYRRVLPEVARATSWRNQLHNVQDRKYKYDAVSCFHELIEQAEYFESWIQGFRRRRLVQLFGWVEEILYCSDDARHSQQNRCLVSGRRQQQLRQNGGDTVGGATTTATTTTTTTTTTAFFNLLEERFVQLKDILPIDLRPYGVVSRKYEYYPVA